MIFKIENVEIYEKSKIKEKINSQFSKDKEYNIPHIDEIFKRFPEKGNKFLKTISMNDYIAFDIKNGNIVLLEHVNSGNIFINFDYLTRLLFIKEKKINFIKNKKDSDLTEDGKINYSPGYETHFDINEKPIFKIKTNSIISDNTFNKNHNYDIKIFWENLPKWTPRAEKINSILDEGE